jgi:hypothetical protein
MPREPEDAADLHDLAIDRQHRAHDAEIDRKEYANGNERNLRRLENPEPEDEERNPGNRGNGAEPLQARIDDAPHQRGIACDRSQKRACDRAEAKAERNAQQGRNDMTKKLAGLRELGELLVDPGRRRHEPAVGKPEPDDRLPDHREANRQREADQRPRPAR